MYVYVYIDKVVAKQLETAMLSLQLDSRRATAHYFSDSFCCLPNTYPIAFLPWFYKHFSNRFNVSNYPLVNLNSMAPLFIAV